MWTTVRGVSWNLLLFSEVPGVCANALVVLCLCLKVPGGEVDDGLGGAEDVDDVGQDNLGHHRQHHPDQRREADHTLGDRTGPGRDQKREGGGDEGG